MNKNKTLNSILITMPCALLAIIFAFGAALGLCGCRTTKPNARFENNIEPPPEPPKLLQGGRADYVVPAGRMISDRSSLQGLHSGREIQKGSRFVVLDLVDYERGVVTDRSDPESENLVIAKRNLSMLSAEFEKALLSTGNMIAQTGYASPPIKRGTIVTTERIKSELFEEIRNRRPSRDTDIYVLSIENGRIAVNAKYGISIEMGKHAKPAINENPGLELIDLPENGINGNSCCKGIPKNVIPPQLIVKFSAKLTDVDTHDNLWSGDFSVCAIATEDGSDMILYSVVRTPTKELVNLENKLKEAYDDMQKELDNCNKTIDRNNDGISKVNKKEYKKRERNVEGVKNSLRYAINEYEELLKTIPASMFLEKEKWKSFIGKNEKEKEAEAEERRASRPRPRRRSPPRREKKAEAEEPRASGEIPLIPKPIKYYTYEVRFPNLIIHPKAEDTKSVERLCSKKMRELVKTIQFSDETKKATPSTGGNFQRTKQPLNNSEK